MRTPLGPSRSSWSLHRMPSISDALVVTCRHARIGLRDRPMRSPTQLCLAAGNWTERWPASRRTLEHPTRKGLMHSSPRTPSVVFRTYELSPEGLSSVEPWRTSAWPRTVSPSLHPCPASAVLRASSWLAPSRSTRPCDLPVRKTRDASNRLLPPERLTCTHPPYVLDSLERLSPPGTPRDSLWLSRCMIEGTSVFTTPEPLQPRIPSERVVLMPSASRLSVTSAGLLDLRRTLGRDLWHLCRELLFLFALTSPSCVVSSLRACPYGFGRCVKVGRVRSPPRPSSPPAREDQRL